MRLLKNLLGLAFFIPLTFGFLSPKSLICPHRQVDVRRMPPALRQSQIYPPIVPGLSEFKLSAAKSAQASHWLTKYPYRTAVVLIGAFVLKCLMQYWEVQPPSAHRPSTTTTDFTNLGWLSKAEEQSAPDLVTTTTGAGVSVDVDVSTEAPRTTKAAPWSENTYHTDPNKDKVDRRYVENKLREIEELTRGRSGTRLTSSDTTEAANIRLEFNKAAVAGESLKLLPPRLKDIAKINDFSLLHRNFTGKRVLFRCSMEPNTSWPSLLVSSIEYLVEQGARVLVGVSYGTPRGGRFESEWSTQQLVSSLGLALGREVGFVGDCVGVGVQAAVDALQNGNVTVLENLRFYRDEEDSLDVHHASALRANADLEVYDDLPSALQNPLPSTLGFIAGFQLLRDWMAFNSQPAGRTAGVVHGKLSADHMRAALSLARTSDDLILSGGVSVPLLKGAKSPLDRTSMDWAQAVSRVVAARNVTLHLPGDFCLPDSTAPAPLSSPTMPVGQTPSLIGKKSPSGFGRVVDSSSLLVTSELEEVGPTSMQTFLQVLQSATTIRWFGKLIPGTNSLGFTTINLATSDRYANRSAGTWIDAKQLEIQHHKLKLTNNSTAEKILFKF